MSRWLFVLVFIWCLVMLNSNGIHSTRDWTFTEAGKHVFLPPKSPSPFPGNYSASYSDFVPGMLAGSTVVQRPAPGEGSSQLIHRTLSESCLMEDQPPLWLDDLLNEPETPVRRGGHRRSSSDPFAYFNVPSGFTQDKSMMSVPSWGDFQEFQPHGGLWYPSPFTETNRAKQKNKSMESSSNVPFHRPTNRSIAKDNVRIQSNGPSCAYSLESDVVSSTLCQRQKHAEHTTNASKTMPERKDPAHGKVSSSNADSKRAKQQFAQRSRVRKLQYISELERNVQALQAEGSEVSAEIDFLNQQHMILSMENKSLRQRLENLSQEQLIKTFEHDILEREVGRLRGLYQQQQQQQQQETPSGHKRSSSKDTNLEFSNLSLKH